MNPPRFNDHERHLRAIVDAALTAADPRARTSETLQRRPPRGDRFAVIAAGKAAATMWNGLSDALPGRRDVIMVVPDGIDAPPWALVGDHPLPTERSARAAAAVKRFVESSASSQAGHDGFVLLLSGGASSLLTLPAPGITIDDYAAATRALLGCGRVTIGVLNCIRKHCEQLKGGRLAALMHPLWCDAYVLSDVIGDDLSVIGSGPVAPDPTTRAEAIGYLNHEAEFCVPDGSSVARHLGETREPDTPKPGDPVFERVRHFIVANNATAVDAAAAVAERIGFAPVRVEHGVQGEAADVGLRLASQVRAFTERRPACLVLGGETTVTVGGSRGKGGRNQELALAAAIGIDGLPNTVIATLATDGVDGPTDAAGAIVTGETCARARRLGCEPGEFLQHHDSYTFFGRVGGHNRTGPTGTNVNDLAVALLY